MFSVKTRGVVVIAVCICSNTWGISIIVLGMNKGNMLAIQGSSNEIGTSAINTILFAAWKVSLLRTNLYTLYNTEKRSVTWKWMARRGVV